jgi:hypothetical protein
MSLKFEGKKINAESSYLRPGESETKALIAILILMLAIGPNVAAKCACSLGGASYNFLGDPSMDVNMEGYDELARDNVQASSIAVQNSVVVPDVKAAAESRLSLNLKGKGNIDLALSKTRESISGQGNMTAINGTVPVKAVGKLEGNKLSLDVTASGGELYKFNLANEGSTVMGDFSELLPNGVSLTGLASGKWEI